jgi:4-hydroxy-tetrahydrodipicolinate reductase
MIKVLVNGYLGRMGSEVVNAVSASEGMQVVAGFDANSKQEQVMFEGQAVAPAFKDLAQAIANTAPDVVVDFTVPGAVFGNTQVALAAGVDVVVGTTGLSDEQVQTLGALAQEEQAHLFIAPNFAIGAVLMMQFAAKAAPYFDDAQIVEQHRAGKLDAPSGTALMTADLIIKGRAGAPFAPSASDAPSMGQDCQGVHVHSMRSDGFVANQEVIFGSAGQTLTIRHDSIDRKSYMPGVLLAIRKVAGCPQALTIGLENLMEL